MSRVAARFAWVEPRRRAATFVIGLLARLPRTNCWTIAEHAGDASPHGMQHLLGRAVWDAEAVREDVRAYVVEQLAADDAGAYASGVGKIARRACTTGSRGSSFAMSPATGQRWPPWSGS